MAQFRRHFRIYLKNNHPAYIVDEEGNVFVFHRVTHSKTSGGRKNWPKPNALARDDAETLYVVKKEQRDFKNKFSPFELEVRANFDISYPEIKKVGTTHTLQDGECATITSDTGSHLAKHDYFIGRSRYESSTNIKSKRKKKGKKNG